MNFIKLGEIEHFEAKIESIINFMNELEAKPAGFALEHHSNWLSHGASDDYSEKEEIMKIIGDIDLNVTAARIMTLRSGGAIQEHKDKFLSDNLARLHIPVLTNRDVYFRIEEEVASWREGELWYGDFRKNHQGKNLGLSDRVHIVLDVNVDERMRKSQPALHSYISPGISNKVSRDLSIYQKKFIIPKGLTIPGVFDEKTTEDLVSEIKGVDGGLIVCIDGSPFLKAIPLSGSSLELVGLDVTLTLNHDFSNTFELEGEISIDGKKISSIRRMSGRVA